MRWFYLRYLIYATIKIGLFTAVFWLANVVFPLSPVRSGMFNFFKYMLRYVCKTILTVLPYSFYDLKRPIYSGFLIDECTFTIISSGTSGIFNFFKHMSLTYFFQMILGVVQYISYNLKLPPYAPVVYVQNIKICIHL